MRSNSISIAMLDSRRFAFWPGKTNSQVRALLSSLTIASARLNSATRCARRAFIRSDDRFQINALIRHRESLPRALSADGLNRDSLRLQRRAGFGSQPEASWRSPSANTSRRTTPEAVLISRDWW